MKTSTKTNSQSASEVRAGGSGQRAASRRGKERSTISGRALRKITESREDAVLEPLTLTNERVRNPIPPAGCGRPIAEADASDLVRDAAAWGHEQFALQLEKAKRVGPAKLSNEVLLDFCKGAFGHFRRYYWIQARPFFRELWRRLEEGLVPGIRTKVEACERIGCSIRWAQMIVSGYAEKRNQKKPVTPPECAGSSLPTQSLAADEQPVEDAESSRGDRILKAEDYVIDIQRFAYRKLRKVREHQWDRYRNVCRILAADFRQASEIQRAAEVKAA